MTKSVQTPPHLKHRGRLILLLLVSATTLLTLQGLVTNPFTPVGHVGYIYEEPRLFGNGGYRGQIEGPSSYGGSLQRNRVVNIDVRPTSHPGSATIPTAQGAIEIRWEVRLRPDPLKIREVVEDFGGADWYQRHFAALVGQRIRTVASGDIPSHRFDPAALEAAARAALGETLTEQQMPFVLEGLTVHELHVPEQMVAAARALKPAAAAVNRVAPVEPPTAVIDDGATLIEVSHRREFRGMWLATVSNVDWPSREGLPAEKQKEELVAYLDQLQAMNMNALIFQVRPACDACYRSDLEPWSKWLAGEQGKDPGYDPLEFAIEECRKRSIEFHAWFNPFRGMPTENFEVAHNHITKKLPGSAIPFASMTWMDPGSKQVRDWVIDVVLDVVNRYDIDGVHLDDYFYPYPVRGAVLDDEASYQSYLEEWGYMEKDDWRRHNIDSLVAKLSEDIRAAKPHVKFGVSPFGLYRPGEPSGTRGLDQFTEIYSNPKKWLENGWIDYVTPQLYWRETSNRSYSKLLDWWGETNSLRRHIYAGNSLISLERNNGNWPFSEFKTQLDASREANGYQSLGNIFFGLRVLRGKSGAKVQDEFANNFYPTPALPPAMPWLNNRPPQRPINVRNDHGEIRWDAADSPSTKHWALYSRDAADGRWNLREILPSATTRIDAAPGDFALSAVDRLMQESIGVLIRVAEPTQNPEDAAKADPEGVAGSGSDGQPASDKG